MIAPVLHNSLTHVAWCFSVQIGIALNSRWFDACGNIYHTADRGRSYAFIGVYAQEPPAFIYAKAGSSINSVSPATQTVGNVLLQNNCTLIFPYILAVLYARL